LIRGFFVNLSFQIVCARCESFGVFSMGGRLRMIASMQKLFLNVAASFLFVAPVIAAQAPAGAAQGAGGPDAVATNLVTTVCASCHTLDRVKNKVADKDAWTTTVTRMKDKGAGLTDQQVPLVVEYLTRAAGTLTVPAASGGRGGGGRGGSRGAPLSANVVAAANLKVLTAENVEITMQNITFALGLRCIDCHEVNDFSLDTKPQKLKARMMLEMVRDINAKFGDGKTHVTCWTCHRASTQPEVARPIPK